MAQGRMRAFLVFVGFWVGVSVGAALAGWCCVRVCVSLLDEDEARFRLATVASPTHPPVQASPAWWTTGPTRRWMTHTEVESPSAVFV